VPDYGPILEMLGKLQRQVEEIKDALGRLQAEGEVTMAGVGPAVIPRPFPKQRSWVARRRISFPTAAPWAITKRSTAVARL